MPLAMSAPILSSCALGVGLVVLGLSLAVHESGLGVDAIVQKIEDEDRRCVHHTIGQIREM